MSTPATICIVRWSNRVFRYSYLEALVLERFTAKYGDAVSIEWCAFELRPNLPLQPQSG